LQEHLIAVQEIQWAGLDPDLRGGDG